MDSEQASLGTDHVLGILRRRAPWILLCLILIAAVAYGLSSRQTKRYTATAAIAFNNNELEQQVAGLSASSSNPLAQQNINLELVKFGDMAARTASLLGHGLTAEKVTGSIKVSGQGESSIIDVAASSPEPVLAAAIANTYVRQFVKEQRSAKHQFFTAALALVNKQLAGLTPTQRFGNDGLDLQNRAHTLSLLADLGYNSAQVAQETLVPSKPSSPRTKRNTILGAILGLLLGLAVAFLLERFDRRVREPEQLEEIYRLPLLGVVPKSGALSRSARRRKGKSADLPPAEAEVFNLIRAHLRFFNVDRDVRTVVIASPATGEGKTTIARHLAEAAARLGSRVLLLEVDLRQPTLAQQLSIQAGPGLADVLVGTISMDEALQLIDLPASSTEEGRVHTLDVLAAGAELPPNPGELLDSRAMSSVLERVKSVYDLVVVDTPPLSAVSDALPLLTKVDGVVIVGSIGRSRRDVAERLHQVLSGSGAPLLGVIANRSKSGGPSPYPTDRKSASTAASANGASSPEEFVPAAKS
jgi:succinoglycan biosynthesis transport protein ExoP